MPTMKRILILALLCVPAWAQVTLNNANISNATYINDAMEQVPASLQPKDGEVR
jgi:hypothetical protein